MLNQGVLSGSEAYKPGCWHPNAGMQVIAPVTGEIHLSATTNTPLLATLHSSGEPLHAWKGSPACKIETACANAEAAELISGAMG